MEQAFLDQLRAITGENGVLSGDDVTSRATGFFPPDKSLAQHLVRPRNTGEVAAVMALAHAARQSVVTHGGRTGLVHGADSRPGDLILSLERMNGIEEIDPVQRIAVAQAGVTLQALQEAAEARDL